jgi:hypothetical protein
MLAVRPLALVMREYMLVEAPWCGAPGVCSVKSSLGSLWPAAQALPCRPDEHLGNGERDFSSSLLFSFFSGHGL